MTPQLPPPHTIQAQCPPSLNQSQQHQQQQVFSFSAAPTTNTFDWLQSQPETNDPPLFAQSLDELATLPQNVLADGSSQQQSSFPPTNGSITHSFVPVQSHNHHQLSHHQQHQFQLQTQSHNLPSQQHDPHDQNIQQNQLQQLLKGPRAIMAPVSTSFPPPISSNTRNPAQLLTTTDTFAFPSVNDISTSQPTPQHPPTYQPIHQHQSASMPTSNNAPIATLPPCPGTQQLVGLLSSSNGAPLLPPPPQAHIDNRPEPLHIPDRQDVMLNRQPQFSQSFQTPDHQKSPMSMLESSMDLSKPINALGPQCFAGFYLVALTRTLVKNRTLPLQVRRAFMAPQLHFRFTVRDPKWRNVVTVHIPYKCLSDAGEWLRCRLGVVDEPYTFKQIKDPLQKLVTDAWADGNWQPLINVLGDDFADVPVMDVDDALECVSGRPQGTPHQFFRQVNCHKGAPDIRRDVDGAISAENELRIVLEHLGLPQDGSNIPVTQFRNDVYPLWRQRCPYIREHDFPDCCQFYDGGYFKKIMYHKHLYNVSSCNSSYHVKDIFEGLQEVRKVWNNPTGMCVREAKCAAGLRYNVDKSFQSSIRSYSKARYLHLAPRMMRELEGVKRRLFDRVRYLVNTKLEKYPHCRDLLREIEIKSESLTHRQLPDSLYDKNVDFEITGQMPGARKRKRHERDAAGMPSTPREQKRIHAHLSLQRKKAMHRRYGQYIQILREDCQKQKNFLESVKQHGEDCSCHVVHSTNRYPTSANTPVA